MENCYSAKKAIFTGKFVIKILFAWLIIPLISLIIDICKAICYKIEIKEGVISIEQGVLSKSRIDFNIINIRATITNQTLFGRIFHYGNVFIDCIGDKRIVLDTVKKPDNLKEFLDLYVKNMEIPNSPLFEKIGIK